MPMLHASCVEIDGVGVLLRGAPGAGKSDLALRLIDGGARLIADDQVIVERENGVVFAAPPPTIAGMIEVRGIGIFKLAHGTRAALGLVVDLVAGDAVERLPQPARSTCAGVELPRICIAPFEASACAKIRLAVGHE